METQTEKRILEASGRLLTENGIRAFSIEKLSKLPEMQSFDIFALVENEEQIFKQLLLQLEKELRSIMDEITSYHDIPALEFEMLFKQLHRLFKQKPYYLTVVFDTDLHWKYRDIEEIILRIKGMAKSYLTRLIERGKVQKVFTTDIKTKVLVKEILGSFKALMIDIQLSDKLVRDLKKYQSATD